MGTHVTKLTGKEIKKIKVAQGSRSAIGHCLWNEIRSHAAPIGQILLTHSMPHAAVLVCKMFGSTGCPVSKPFCLRNEFLPGGGGGGRADVVCAFFLVGGSPVNVLAVFWGADAFAAHL